ncbi:N-acetylglucosaminyl-phosphatidylinositol de-N-acetylase, putative [Entamoeba histolytica HM-1:IMSS-B]|uniref:N-acetylglucosaminylphosphatidylinositol deacetylase n=6 Tax=Entamoeba histolytica TaxID=5759 RepID=C4M0W5_ENTH1|nr:N-acetylglucosaminyl-phosphatidylinositol de-N-acetylase, putative [Entamoeba histolytica HM-1:IMSS]EMD46537.1 Nacetylglucosaminyl-phosphatidylinositol de-N-acetylase, putative [Entamoeba histolytica KU27]EMH72735.1 N-acetylglucosaminyl-phosphatidylinositol de-N-acetylase, putative [Entamoeba histolytica HM-1:IMSS-B]EMS12073.1 N-acetylglucosaminyl-phosphatidylinositol de-N-acetylase [Entamoeba histolytica HM-3:IMSS]ENY63006.1 N-acetylglucosaminyl-phosphatidylinositol de-N-acetylase, putative|eukprot:XP_654497.1 N-acetylglucosaminyl-phosphatidylinositol de-N-acetylase, putative [Entamoeba histolytica HM-1:IMSS]
MSSTTIIICVILAIIIILIESWCHKAVKKQLKIRDPVLFLFAHADDDAMFFIPTIEYLKQNLIPFGMFLFSSNPIRKKEFENAAKFHKCENITICDPTKYPDGFEYHWDIMEMAKDVAELIQKENIQTIITFDKKGVSGHPNHININAALPMIHTFCPHVSIYTLKSKNIIRKYSHTIDCICSFFEKDDERTLFTVLDSNEYATSSMKLYPSQFVWFRHIYLAFSTYTKLNQLVEYY